jgi:hypothetical protein
MDFPQSPQQSALPERLLDAELIGRYRNGLIRLVEDGELQFTVGVRRVLDAIYGGFIRTATSQIWLAAESRQEREPSAIHPLHLLEWVVLRADIIDGARTTPAFAQVRDLPIVQAGERWRWMSPVRYCRVPMTESEFCDFREVVEKLEARKNLRLLLAVDKNRQPIAV